MVTEIKSCNKNPASGVFKRALDNKRWLEKQVKQKPTTNPKEKGLHNSNRAFGHGLL